MDCYVYILLVLVWLVLKIKCKKLLLKKYVLCNFILGFKNKYFVLFVVKLEIEEIFYGLMWYSFLLFVVFLLIMEVELINYFF